VTAALEQTAPDRVGRTLLWGLGFSFVFHVVLFSPQLAAALDPENRHEVIAELREAAKSASKPNAKDPDRAPDAPKQDRPPEDPAKPPPAGAAPPPPPEPPAGPKQAAKKPADPPDLPPIETPTPSPAYPDVEDVAIGQDDGDPMSVVIIGHDDYEEHIAQLSVVNQAGYRMSDAGGDGTVAYGRGESGSGGGGGGSAPKATATTVADASPGTPPAPDSTRTESAAPAPQPDTAPVRENPPPATTPAVVAKAEPKPQDAAEPVPPAPHVPASSDPSASEPVPPPDAPRDPQATPPEEPKPTPPPADPAKEPPLEQPRPAQSPSTEIAPPEQRPAAPPPANQPPPVQPGGGIASSEKAKDGPADQAPGEAGRAGGQGPSAKAGTGGKGELSDLESPATSTIAVPGKQWRNGRLIAAVGVQLKPRQPQFTTLQMVSMLPQCQPPVVSLTFDREGKCVDVFFNRTSGDPEIDGVIRNSLFFWRATGRKIDELKGDEKVRVTLTLLL
jgi:hypothetical protein